MKKFGKKYSQVLEKMGDVKTPRSLAEAVVAVLEADAITKFDATAEIHVKTGCDPKHADQIVRSTIVLPHGTGKTVKIAVFCDEEKVDEMKKLGADIAGGASLIAEVLKGNIDFDIALAEPAMMKELAKAARVLGPKGLMPSPKAGTVTPNLAQAIDELKKGKIEFKTDKNGIVHSVFGKLSFGKDKLTENVTALFKAIVDAKPTGIKGAYITGVTLTSTMGPAVAVETTLNA
jgi:large subunit ribosomal protein L1